MPGCVWSEESCQQSIKRYAFTFYSSPTSWRIMISHSYYIESVKYQEVEMFNVLISSACFIVLSSNVRALISKYRVSRMSYHILFCVLVKAIAWFNNAAYHSTAVSLNAFNNAMYKYLTNSTGTITTINHPLPRTTSQSIDDLSRYATSFGSQGPNPDLHLCQLTTAAYFKNDSLISGLTA